MKYLLDTNIVIFLFKNKFNIRQRIKEVGKDNCYISEITLAELKFGAARSSNIEKHIREVEDFVGVISVIPISSALDVFAEEKARLSKEGNIIDNFDLLIGATAISNQMTMVTNNLKHFQRLHNLKIEDWAISI